MLNFFPNKIQASSLLIIWSKNVYYLYISRVLVGFVNGNDEFKHEFLTVELKKSLFHLRRFDHFRSNFRE